MDFYEEEKDNKKKIKTVKKVYPQIYSYILPEEEDKRGWQKIGYTERKNVDTRIKEQTQTAAMILHPVKLWSENSFYEPISGKKFFTDKDLHKFLVKSGIKRKESGLREWFYFNGTPEKSKQLFDQFKHGDFSSLGQTGVKQPYNLRAEQKQAVEKTLNYIQNGENSKPEFLWNAKPRFGKTLTTYDLAVKLGARNVLILTNRPAIANSWYDDFEKFIDGYYFISTTKSLKNRPALSREDFNKIPEIDKKQFTFLSLQDIKGSKYFGGAYDKLKYVADLKWDLVVIDEAHEGVDTEPTDEVLDGIQKDFTLHLSGTPFKALETQKFSQEQIYNWTYLDEQKAKQAEIRNGDDSGAHIDMPDMRLFTYKLSDMITDKINQGIEIDGQNRDYTFDLNEFFAVNEQAEFIHKTDVLKFLDTLTTNEKYPFSTPELRNELKHTFWLVGNRVASAKALEKVLRNHPVFENYKIVIAAGDGKPIHSHLSEEDKLSFEQEIVLSDEKFRNEDALKRVRKAIAENDKTITLSVGQLTTGVTVKEWSAVLMLSDIKSQSLYMQTIFRAQNPYKYIKQDDIYRKKSAYVFDFSPARVLETYDAFANHNAAQNPDENITTVQQQANVGELLNYFPVISEDKDGKMIELDAEQVLTFPKAIRAKEVVEHQFITNLLFRDINAVFRLPAGMRDALNKLKGTKTGSTKPTNTENTKDRSNADKEAKDRKDTNKARLTKTKIYNNQIQEAFNQAKNQPNDQFAKNFSDSVGQMAETMFDEYASTYKSTKKDLQDKKDDCIQKIYEVAETFVASPQTEKDMQELIEATSKLVNNEIPNNLVDKAEQEIAETEAKSDIDIIKEKLRTFARAIPSFVMASANPENLKISNIEDSVSDQDFEELFSDKLGENAASFTKEDFRKLRDGMDYVDEQTGETKHFDGLFDEHTFNAAIQEFEQKRRDLADYLRTDQQEDIFSYIPAQKTNQIFTPRTVVNQMLDILEKENPGIFKNPNLTFCDLYIKSGLFLSEIAKRLFVGLQDQIPNEDQRIKHIFEQQLFGFAPTRILYDIATKYVVGGLPSDISHNIKHQDLTEDFKKGDTKDMKFDVVVGNPPYQLNDNGKRDDGSANASASPVYHYFIDSAKKISKIQSFVIPSRWAMGAGKGLSKFTKEMINDQDIQAFVYYSNPKDIFPDNDIKGGICYFVRKEGYNNKTNVCVVSDGEKEISVRFLNSANSGIFIPFAELASILEKVKENSIDLERQNIQKIVSVLKPYGLRTDFLKDQSKYNLPFVNDKKQSDDDIEILGLAKGNKRISKFVPSNYPIPKGKNDIKCWKVFVPYAYGAGAIGETIPTPILGTPIQICTETYLRIGRFETKQEAEAMLSYLKSKFFRVLVGILKTTQHATTTFRYVPLQNFTANSDIDWSRSIPEIDRQLYAKYGLSQAEIDFIEEKVKEME